MWSPGGGAHAVVGLATLPPSLEETEDDGLLADIVALPGAVSPPSTFRRDIANVSRQLHAHIVSYCPGELHST